MCSDCLVGNRLLNSNSVSAGSINKTKSKLKGEALRSPACGWGAQELVRGEGFKAADLGQVTADQCCQRKSFAIDVDKLSLYLSKTDSLMHWRPE